MADIKNYAVVDENGNIVNVVAWDGESDYNPGEGLILVQSDTAGIGWTYANGQFTAPDGG